MNSLQKLLAELPQLSFKDADMVEFGGYEDIKNLDITDTTHFLDVLEWFQESNFPQLYRCFVFAELLNQPIAVEALSGVPDSQFARAAAESPQSLFNFLNNCSADELADLSQNDDLLILSYLRGGLSAFEILLNTPDDDTTELIRFHTLIWAANFGVMDVLERLLQLPSILAHVNDPIDNGQDGDNALGLASEEGHLAIVERLLREPTIAEQADFQDNDALIMACSNSHTLVVERLLEEPVVREKAHTNQNMALRFAYGQKNWDIIALLMKITSVTMLAQQMPEFVEIFAFIGDVSTVQRLLADTQAEHFIQSLNEAVVRSAHRKHTVMVNHLLETNMHIPPQLHEAYWFKYHEWNDPEAKSIFRNALKRALWVNLQKEAGFDTVDTASKFVQFALSKLEHYPRLAAWITPRDKPVLVKQLMIQILSLAYYNPFIWTPDFKYGHSPYSLLADSLRQKIKCFVGLPRPLQFFDEAQLAPSCNLARRCLYSWARQHQTIRQNRVTSEDKSNELNLSNLRIR